MFPQLLALGVVDLLILLALWLLGVSLVSCAVGRLSLADGLALGLPVGIGLLTWTLFISSWAGIRVSLWSAAGSGLLLAVVALVLRRIRNVRGFLVTLGGPRGAPRLSAESLVVGALGLAVVVLVAASIIISVGAAYRGWDAMAIWALRGYGTVLEGTVFASTTWGSHNLAYPLNTSLAIALFRMIDGDVVPGSKFLFPAFLVSLLAGCYGFWRKSGARASLAMAGVFFVASMPTVFFHSTIGYANLPAAAYLVIGGLWLVEGIEHRDRGKQWLAGLLLALAAWTRLEVLMHAVILMAVFLGLARVFRLRNVDLAGALAPATIIAGSWMLFFLTFGAEGSQAAGAVSEVMRVGPEGWLNQQSLGMIAERMRLQFSWGGAWGALGLVALAAVALAPRGLLIRPRYRPVALLLGFLGMGSATAVTFYIGSFLGGDVSGWLDRSLTRHFLPAAILLVALAIERLATLGTGVDGPGAIASPRIP